MRKWSALSQQACGRGRRLWMSADRCEVDTWSLGWFSSSWVSWPSPGSPGSKASATVCFAVFSPPGPSHSPDRAKCTAHQGPGEQVPDVWGWSCCCCHWPLREGELEILEKWAMSCQGIECAHQAFRKNFCLSVCCVVSFFPNFIDLPLTWLKSQLTHWNLSLWWQPPKGLILRFWQIRGMFLNHRRGLGSVPSIF